MKIDILIHINSEIILNVFCLIISVIEFSVYNNSINELMILLEFKYKIYRLTFIFNNTPQFNYINYKLIIKPNEFPNIKTNFIFSGFRS